MATDVHGNLYVAGIFTNDNSDVYIAKWNGNEWSELGGNNSSSFYWLIWDIEILDNGNILITTNYQNPLAKPCVAKFLVSDTYPDILTNKIFPNPATEYISIKGSFIEIKIVDIWGKAVLKKQFDDAQGITKIIVSNLVTGVYFFVGENIEKQTIIQKFIKK